MLLGSFNYCKIFSGKNLKILICKSQFNQFYATGLFLYPQKSSQVARLKNNIMETNVDCYLLRISKHFQMDLCELNCERIECLLFSLKSLENHWFSDDFRC